MGTLFIAASSVVGMRVNGYSEVRAVFDRATAA